VTGGFKIKKNTSGDLPPVFTGELLKQCRYSFWLAMKDGLQLQGAFEWKTLMCEVKNCRFTCCWGVWSWYLTFPEGKKKKDSSCSFYYEVPHHNQT